MATLFEYNQAMRMALEILSTNENAEIVNEDGEIVNVKDYIAGLEGDIHEKIEATILFTQELEAEIDGIKAKEKSLKERRTSKENLIERLRKGVAETMLEQGEMKYETSNIALSFRKSETVEVDDTFDLPQKYIKRTVEEKPDKVELKKALKAGEIIPGAMLMVHQNLQVK